MGTPLLLPGTVFRAIDHMRTPSHHRWIQAQPLAMGGPIGRRSGAESLGRGPRARPGHRGGRRWTWVGLRPVRGSRVRSPRSSRGPRATCRRPRIRLYAPMRGPTRATSEAAARRSAGRSRGIPGAPNIRLVGHFGFRGSQLPVARSKSAVPQPRMDTTGRRRDTRFRFQLESGRAAARPRHRLRSICDTFVARQPLGSPIRHCPGGLDPYPQRPVQVASKVVAPADVDTSWTGRQPAEAPHASGAVGLRERATSPRVTLRGVVCPTFRDGPFLKFRCSKAAYPRLCVLVFRIGIASSAAHERPVGCLKLLLTCTYGTLNVVKGG